MITNNFKQNNNVHRNGCQNIERLYSGSAVVVSEARGMFFLGSKVSPKNVGMPYTLSICLFFEHSKSIIPKLSPCFR